MKKKSLDLFAREWFEKASEDEQTVKLLLEEGGLPNPICFLSQQMAEKYLKGFMVFLGYDVEKVHDLTRVAALIKEKIPEIEDYKEEFTYLNQFYVTTRYPGDYPTFSMKDAKEAYEAALRVKDFVLEKIK